MKNEINLTYKRKAIALPDDDTNGTTIRVLRQERDMPQKALAEALDISAAYLCDLEQGNRSMNEETFDRAKEAILKYKPASK